MASDPTPTTAIDAETMAKARDCWATIPHRVPLFEAEMACLFAIGQAIQAEKAEGDHFKSHFTKLAKVNPAANAALDTARREWAKRAEGK